MNSKNTGVEYEKLIQEIYTHILNQDIVKTVDVKQNVIIKGKTVTHQIDVYWEFEAGGVIYKTIVQAKDWKNTVKQGDILLFSAVLNDIPGNPHGIYITKTGYQKGAKEYAEAHEISLYELRQPTEQDWDGKMRNLEIRQIVTTPALGDISIVIDKEWLEDNNITPNFSLLPKGFTMYDVPLYNDKHENLTTIRNIIKGYLKDTNDTDTHRINHIFESPVFLREENNDVFFKLKAIEFDYQYHQSIYKHQIIGDDIVKYILKNTITNEVRTIGKDLKPLGKIDKD